MRIAALLVLTLVSCDGPAHVTVDAGSHDPLGLEEAMRPGLECLKRETEASKYETTRLLAEAVKLEAQIDVLSGAYSLRHQLETESQEKALRHAMAVLKSSRINQEQTAVAYKFLKDTNVDVNAEMNRYMAQIDPLRAPKDAGRD